MDFVIDIKSLATTTMAASHTSRNPNRKVMEKHIMVIDTLQKQRWLPNYALVSQKGILQIHERLCNHVSAVVKTADSLDAFLLL